MMVRIDTLVHPARSTAARSADEEPVLLLDRAETGGDPWQGEVGQ